MSYFLCKDKNFLNLNLKKSVLSFFLHNYLYIVFEFFLKIHYIVFMSLFNIYNKAKKNLNKSSFNQKMQFPSTPINLLKRYVVSGLVDSSALDSAFPKNTKLKFLKNVSQRSMKTFYKIADKHLMNKHGVLSQTNKLDSSVKKKLSNKAKSLLKLIESDSVRYTKIDNLISKFKNK